MGPTKIRIEEVAPVAVVLGLIVIGLVVEGDRQEPCLAGICLVFAMKWVLRFGTGRLLRVTMPGFVLLMSLTGTESLWALNRTRGFLLTGLGHCMFAQAGYLSFA